MIFSQSFQANSGTSPRLDNCHFFPNYIVFRVYGPPITLPLTVQNLSYREHTKWPTEKDWKLRG